MSPASSPPPALPQVPAAPPPPVAFGAQGPGKKPKRQSEQQSYLGADTLPSPSMRAGGKTLLGA